MTDDNDPDTQYELGCQALDDGEFKTALQIGKKLRKLRHSSAFEVMARAYRGLDQEEKAIRVLEEAVRRCPDVGQLWHQLACYYSDAGRYADAHEAFVRCRIVEGGVSYWADLNEAQVYLREDEPARALALLATIPEETAEPERIAILRVRTSALLDVNRYAEVIDICDAVLADPLSFGLEQLTETDGSLNTDTISSYRVIASFYSERAEAIWKLRADRQAALRDCFEAIELHRGNDHVLRLIRLIEDQCSPTARLFNLLVEGQWHEPTDANKPIPNFMTMYHVIADTAEEALSLAARFEPEPTRHTLRIDEQEVLEERPNEAKGVTDLYGHIFYPPESDDDTNEARQTGAGFRKRDRES